MAFQEACCTCATLLSALPRFVVSSSSSSSYSAETEPGTAGEKEKPLPSDRRVGCCSRVICGNCIHKNGRFASYCPYCQISTGPSSLPVAGLKDPPPYHAASSGGGIGRRRGQQHPRDEAVEAPPPPYSPSAADAAASSSPSPSPPPARASSSPTPATPPPSQDPPAVAPTEQTLHFLRHPHDTIPSLSLRYGVPAADLRRANRLGSDHLLLARRVIVIPPPPTPAPPPPQRPTSRSASSSPPPQAAKQQPRQPPPASLSPDPVESEEEERRKSRIRRWMVTCKEADYDVAVLYLEQYGYDMDAAVEAYFADEEWEARNPVVVGGSSSSSSSGRRTGGGGRRPLGRFGLGGGGGGAGEGGWMWAAQAPFLRSEGAERRRPGGKS